MKRSCQVRNRKIILANTLLILSLIFIRADFSFANGYEDEKIIPFSLKGKDFRVKIVKYEPESWGKPGKDVFITECAGVYGCDGIRWTLSEALTGKMGPLDSRFEVKVVSTGNISIIENNQKGQITHNILFDGSDAKILPQTAPSIPPVDKKTSALVPVQISDSTSREVLTEKPLDSSFKYGYLDMQKILKKSSDWVRAEQELSKLRQTHQVKIDKKEREIAELDQQIRNTPNKNDTFIAFMSVSITLQKNSLESLKLKAQKEIEAKREELASATAQELMWKIKRLGKTNNYALILSKNGFRLFEKNMLKDEKDNVIYKNDEMDISRVRASIEDFDDITNTAITYVNAGEIISPDKMSSSASGIKPKDPKEEPIKVSFSTEVERELFPAMAKFVLDKNFDKSGFVTWTIRNDSTEQQKITLSSEIPEWTQPSIKTIDIGPYETKTLGQTPFGKDLLKNHSIIPTTMILKAKAGDKIVFQETKNISIRAGDDMIWSWKTPWQFISLIAAWVTPKDPAVEQILSRAKEKLYSRSLHGYQRNNKQDVIAQARAVFDAVRDTGISYVSSAVNFGQIGFTQRVRLPKQSIEQKAANCIDGSVLLASLYENIGLEPLIIFVHAHAFVGVRLAPGSQETLFIETTMVGRNPMDSALTLTNTFDAAVKAANDRYFQELQIRPSEVRIVDIKIERQNGIYPLW